MSLASASMEGAMMRALEVDDMKQQHAAIASRVLPGARPLTVMPFDAASRVGVINETFWWEGSHTVTQSLPAAAPRGRTPGRPPPPQVESTGNGVTLRRARGRVLGGKAYTPAAAHAPDLIALEPSYFAHDVYRAASQLSAGRDSFDSSPTRRPHTQLKEHQNYELRRAAPPAALPSLAAAAPRAACFTPAPQPTTADAPADPEARIKRFFVNGLFRGRCQVSRVAAGRAVAAGGVYQCKTLRTGRQHWAPVSTRQLATPLRQGLVVNRAQQLLHQQAPCLSSPRYR